MLGEIVFRQTALPTLMKSMDANMLRSRVISNNIANVNTPGFRRLDVSFENHLRDALDRIKLKGVETNENHMSIGRKDISKVNPETVRPSDPTLPSGVNNVDIDTEMAKLAEAQIAYNFSARLAKGVLNKINSAIQARSVQLQ